jgi:hypothetical protein
LPSDIVTAAEVSTTPPAELRVSTVTGAPVVPLIGWFTFVLVGCVENWSVHPVVVVVRLLLAVSNAKTLPPADVCDHHGKAWSQRGATVAVTVTVKAELGATCSWLSWIMFAVTSTTPLPSGTVALVNLHLTGALSSADWISDRDVPAFPITTVNTVDALAGAVVGLMLTV